MEEDGIDVLARLERLEKRVIELEMVRINNMCVISDLSKDNYVCDHNYPMMKSTIGKICQNCGRVVEPLFAPNNICDHNYPRLESTAGKTCSNCGKVMEHTFAPRETTGIRL